MKRVKSWSAVTLCVVMLLSLIGCGGGEDGDEGRRDVPTPATCQHGDPRCV